MPVGNSFNFCAVVLQLPQPITQPTAAFNAAAAAFNAAAFAAAPAGGLPDLLLWRPSDRTAKCVEVKGPRDRLSHQQRFWLAAMARGELAVEVCKVREPAATSRSRQQS
jgi:hypothetical protein